VLVALVFRLVDRLAVGRRHVVPSPGHLRRPLEVVGRALVGRRDLESGEVTLESFGRVLEARLVEGGHLAVELELRRRVLLVAEFDLERGRETFEVVRVPVDRDEGLGGGEMIGVELEHLLVASRGAIVFLLLVAPELGDLHEKADLGSLVLLAGFLSFEHADELVPLAAFGVEDLEVVPLAEGEVLLLERFLSLAIVGIEREQHAPRGDGTLVVVQTIAVEGGELAQDLHALRVVDGDLGLLLEHGGQGREILRALVEAREVA
jgi:hypothetical protein